MGRSGRQDRTWDLAAVRAKSVWYWCHRNAIGLGSGGLAQRVTEPALVESHPFETASCENIAEGLNRLAIRIIHTLRAAIVRYSLDVLVAAASGIELWRQLGTDLLVVAVLGAILGGVAVDRVVSYVTPRLADARSSGRLVGGATAPTDAKVSPNSGREPVQILFDNLKLHRGFLMSWSAWFRAGDRAIADLQSDNEFYAAIYNAAEYAQIHNRFYGGGLGRRQSARAFHLERPVDRDGEYHLTADQGWEKRTVYLSVKWVRVPRTALTENRAPWDSRPQ